MLTNPAPWCELLGCRATKVVTVDWNAEYQAAIDRIRTVAKARSHDFASDHPLVRSAIRTADAALNTTAPLGFVARPIGVVFRKEKRRSWGAGGSSASQQAPDASFDAAKRRIRSAAAEAKGRCSVNAAAPGTDSSQAPALARLKAALRKT